MCQILSKPLEISKKIPLSSKPLSNDWWISSVIDKSWYIHESPCLKTDWLDDIKSWYYNKNSNIFPHIESNETGR